MTDLRRGYAGFAAGLVLLLVAGAGGARAASYTEVFYPSGKLKIEAYLYRPAGRGPFPLIIYNHGSREFRERVSVPFTYIGEMLTAANYAVMVPERRGYGKSDGTSPGDDIGSDVGPRLIGRLQAETDDVLAAVDYLRTVDGIDTSRLGMIGWSLGGIVTMLAISRSDAFKAAIDQAGGSLTWERSAAVREAVTEAARHARAPVFLMVAANDKTTAAIRAVDNVLTDRHWPHETRIYPAFTPSRSFPSTAPGHLIFSSEGASIWQHDAIAFLDRYLKPGK